MTRAQPALDHVRDALVMADRVHHDCERVTEGFLGQPANTITALAFVVAATAIVAAGGAERRAPRWVFALLVAATGIGSVIQHGPHPTWQGLAHDLPLIALMLFLAIDATADLKRRSPQHVLWVAPTIIVAPVVAASPLASQWLQAAAASAAIGVFLARAFRRPGLRSPILGALVLLAIGSAVGTLSRTGWPLCDPGSLLQGHALWHVLAAAAMWRLGPVIGCRGEPSPQLGIGRVDVHP